MNFNDAMKKAKERTLEIISPKITLTQNKASKPITLTLTGVVRQLETGQLVLKGIVASQENAKGDGVCTSTITENLLEGEIIPESCSFKLKVETVSGQVWVAEKVYTTSGKHRFGGKKSITIDANIDSITAKNILAGQIERAGMSRGLTLEANYPILPKNDITDLGENGIVRNKTKLSFLGKKCTIIQEEKNINIYINSKRTISNNERNAIVNALEIASGCGFKKISEYVSCSSYMQCTIFSFDHGTKARKLSTPIKTDSPRNAVLVEKITRGYCSQKLEDRKKIYHYWQDISTSYNAGMNAYSKALGATVEGMVKSFYPEIRKKDLLFASLCGDSIKDIELAISEKRLTLHPRVKESIMAKLKSAGGASIYTGLIDVYGDEVARCWNDLRNPASHGAFYEKYKGRDADLLRDSKTCLAIFYDLLLEKIGYKGNRINYAKEGCPETKESLKITKQ